MADKSRHTRTCRQAQPARAENPNLKSKETTTKQQKTGRPRFDSVTVWGWDGSSGSDFWFWRFLCKRGFSVFQYRLTGKAGSGFGSWKTVPAVLVPLSVSGKTVPTVPVSGSGSVPEPP